MDKNHYNLISAYSISIIIALSAIVASSSYLPFANMASAQQLQQQQQNASSSGSNTANNNNATTDTLSSVEGKPPTDGYSTPEGHLTAIRHVFDDPTLRVQHYCKPNDKILLVCQLYDSNSSKATLIGIEYIITADQYNSLPNREKPAWHYHLIEFATNRADAKFPELTPQKEGESLKKLADTYGKVILTWNPKDKLPAFPPQVEEVQHPFMVNSTATPNTTEGSFNQTLKY